MIAVGKLNKRVRFERAVVVRDAYNSVVRTDWQEVVTTYAEVYDLPPAKSETTELNLRLAAVPCRITIRYRTNLDVNMRAVILGPKPRTLELVGGPAEVGNKDWIQFLAQSYLEEPEPAP